MRRILSDQELGRIKREILHGDPTKADLCSLIDMCREQRDRLLAHEGPRKDDDQDGCCGSAPIDECRRMSVVEMLRSDANDLEKRACCLRELADALPGKLPQNADDVLFSIIAAARRNGMF
jgi:hypothetical protein